VNFQALLEVLIALVALWMAYVIGHVGGFW